MFAEVLAGAALVKSSVDAIKSAIGTAKDISEIADEIDKLFLGEQQIQKQKSKKRNSPLSLGSVARETIDAKLAQEQMYEIKNLVNMRFGHGTWEGIIAERAKRIREQKEQERIARVAKDKQREEVLVIVGVLSALLAALGFFAFIFILYTS